MARRIAVGVEYLSDYRAGIARVGMNLFNALLAVDHDTEYILVTDRHIPRGDIEKSGDFVLQQQSVFYPKLPDPLAIPLWTQSQLPQILCKIDVDLYFHTGTPPLLPFLPPWPKIRKIVFLHDIINVKSPRLLSMRLWPNGWRSGF